MVRIKKCFLTMHGGVESCRANNNNAIADNAVS